MWGAGLNIRLSELIHGSFQRHECRHGKFTIRTFIIQRCYTSVQQAGHTLLERLLHMICGKPFLFVIDREVFSDQMEQQKDVKPRNRTKKTMTNKHVMFSLHNFFLVPLPDLLWQQLQSRGMDSVFVNVEDFEVRQHSSIAAG